MFEHDLYRCVTMSGNYLVKPLLRHSDSDTLCTVRQGAVMAEARRDEEKGWDEASRSSNFATIFWCFEWSPLTEKSVKGCQQMAT